MHIVYHMISHYSLLYCITLCCIILYCNWTFSMMQRRLKIHVLYMNAAASELICPLTCVHIKWMEMQLKTVYIYVGAGICNPVQYCIVLYCIVLYCFVLYCIMLFLCCIATCSRTRKSHVILQYCIISNHMFQENILYHIIRHQIISCHIIVFCFVQNLRWSFYYTI